MVLSIGIRYGWLTSLREMTVINFFQAILGSASLFGMTTDLALSVTDYSTTPATTSTERLSWATSIFYFGMLAGLYPMTLVLQKFNLRYVFGPVVLLWAVTCAATAGVTSWRGLFVQRFFLGTSLFEIIIIIMIGNYRLLTLHRSH